MWFAAGVAATAFVGLLMRMAVWGGIALAMAVVAGGPILLALMVPLHVTSPAGETLRIYTKNTMGGWGDDAAIAEDIRASSADIVLLQELSATRSDFGATLAESHPHQHICRFSDRTGMAVLSRWPLSDPYCSPERSFAAAQVAAPFGPVWAVSTHLIWPYPYDQMRILERALPFLETIDGRAVVAGDFNMVPWGHSVARVADATGTQVVSPLLSTFQVRGVPVQIDHVLANGAALVERRPRFGADHFGLSTQIVWP